MTTTTTTTTTTTCAESGGGSEGDSGSTYAGGYDWLLSSALHAWLHSEVEPEFLAALKIDARTAPDSEPFKYRYEAREKLEGLIEILDAKLTTAYKAAGGGESGGGGGGGEESDPCTNTSSSSSMLDPEEQRYLQDLILLLRFRVGDSYCDTEETGTGERFLEQVVAAQGTGSNGRGNGSIVATCTRRNAATRLAALNALGVLWAGRGDYEKGLERLQLAEDLYAACASSIDAAPPYGTDELLPRVAVIGERAERDTGTSDAYQAGRRRNFEALYTHTLYYLAQCYGGLGQQSKGADYCQRTLQRQLAAASVGRSRDNDGGGSSFDSASRLDWALNAATMAQYHLSQSDYAMCLHCLAAASLVGAAAEDSDGEAEMDIKMAEIERCWVKLYINLLEDAILLRAQQEATGQAAIDKCQESCGGPDTPVFFELDGLRELELEAGAPLRPPKSSKEANGIFKQGQLHVQAAQKVYGLDGHTSQHVECCRDSSTLWRLLAQLEADSARAAKMHKRRVDILAPLLVDLNPQFFLATCRQLQYELGETLATMVMIKSRVLVTAQKAGTEPKREALEKLDALGERSSSYFSAFVDSFRDRKSKNLPQTFEDDDVQAVLMAQFWLARLAEKKLPRDHAHAASMLRKGEEVYKWIVTYCDAHPNLKVFQQELAVCREILEVVPLKLQQLQLA